MIVTMVTDSELKDLVSSLQRLSGDIAEVEAKRASREMHKSVRATLSAFSNATGGTLVLGLDEAQGFQIVGVDDASAMATRLANLCSDEMEPQLRPLIRINEIDGRDLVVAEIPEIDRSLKPCFYKGAGITQGSYIRVHDGDRRLSSYEVQMMIANRGQPRDDEEPVPSTNIEHLDQQLVASYLSRLRTTRTRVFDRMSDGEILAKTGVLSLDGNACTLGGLLALGIYPQEFFPQLMATFVHYPTVDGGSSQTGERFIDNASFEGSIPQIVSDALLAIRRNMARRSTVTGAGRRDAWEYPETSLRESIVNALVHRDLSVASRGTQVQIEMYPDRLTVRNPGGLFGPVTLDSIVSGGVSSSRNARLLRILEDVPIPNSNGTVCENRGSGIREMINSLRAAGMSLPAFEDRISSFSVAIPNHALLSDEVVQWIRSLTAGQLSDSQCIGLAMMREGQSIDNGSYRSATGIDSRLATTELQDLVERELAVQEGDRRWARYHLSVAALASTQDSASSASRRPPADRRMEILRALDDKELSRSDIAAQTGLSDQVVRNWLRRLRRDGAVTLADPTVSAQSKNTKYRRTSGASADQDTLEF
ncbi:ATP-binding protein [Microlunatus aurantiacus]|uniref:ATP-binding protein n=1 Tax=Microlunatus aurantiacus TaxID=446786 RepID=A0ABP7DN22_9ACTN